MRDIVGAFIFSSDNKLLLGMTDLQAGGVYSGSWVIPGGGIEAGESPAAALRREVWEETGLDITSYPLRLITDSEKGESEKLLKETGERVLVQMNFFDFEIRINKRAEEIGVHPTEELVRLQWTKIEDLAKTNLSPPTRILLEKEGYIK